MKGVVKDLLLPVASVTVLVSFITPTVSAQFPVSWTGQVFKLGVDSRLVQEGVVLSAYYSEKLGPNARLRLSELSVDENSYD